MASRSLGTLTLDLIAKTGLYEGALDKSGRTTKKWANEAKKDLATIGKSFAAVGAGAAAGLVAITKNAIDSAREIENLSKVANTSTQSFQKITYAADRYGVAQDKVADILKDTSDKIGDFLQTGGGPLADFFENIAPQVSVTAEQFRNLSSDQALGLYIKSLEEANVSQNEMTFFMEAIASDATLLLPLFKDNAKELGRLGEQAENFGAVINDVELKQLNEIKTNIDELQGAYKGLGNQVAFATLPAIQELTELLTDPQTIENAKALATGIAAAFNVAVQAISRTIEVVQFLGEEFAAIRVGINSDDIVRLEDDAEKIRSILEDGGIANFGERVRFFGPDGLVEFYSDEELKAELSKLDTAISAYYDNLTNRPTLPVATDLPETAAPDTNTTGRTRFGKDLNEINEYLEALRLEQKLLGKTTAEQELYKLSLKGATDQQLATAKAALEAIDAFEQQQEKIKEIADLEKDLAKQLADEQQSVNDQTKQIAEQLLSEEDQLRLSYQRRREIILRNTETTGNARKDLLEKLAKDEAEAVAEIQAQQQITQLQNYETLFGSLADLTKTFVGEQSTAYKVLFAAEKAASIARAIVAIQTGLAEAAAVPWPANLAAIASVVSATAGIVSTIQSTNIQGVAHDGLMEVPTTGTYLLEKGERVTTEETSAKLDQTLNQVQATQSAAAMMGGVTINSIVIQAPTEQAGREAAGHVARRVGAAVSGAQRYS